MRGIKLQGTLIIEDGMGDIIELEVGVADVVVQVGALQILAFDHLVVIQGILPLAGCERFAGHAPEVGDIVLCLCGGRRQEQQGCDDGPDGRLPGGFRILQLAFDGRNHLDGLIVFIFHLCLATFGRVARKFTFVNQIGQSVYALLADTPLTEFLADGVLRKVCRRNHQLVGDIAQQGLVQLFVIRAAEPLLQIRLGALEPGPGHLVGAAVFRTRHVSAPGLGEAEEPADEEDDQDNRKQ